MPRISTDGWLLPLIAVAVGTLGLSAAWVIATVATGRSCSWMALVGAADIAFMLRLTQARPGRLRSAVAVIATALAIVLSQWLIIGTQLGFALGLEPFAASIRLGPVLAWEFAKLSLRPVDAVFLFAALPLAAILVQAKRVS